MPIQAAIHARYIATALSARTTPAGSSIYDLPQDKIHPRLAKCLVQTLQIKELTPVQQQVVDRIGATGADWYSCVSLLSLFPPFFWARGVPLNKTSKTLTSTSLPPSILSLLPSSLVSCKPKREPAKTIAFLLPALQTLSHHPVKSDQVGILVLSPTRELASQIHKSALPFLDAMPQPIGAHVAYGGTNADKNLKLFVHAPAQLTVATPGRLLDYMTSPEATRKFLNLRVLVLDEADTMLDMGFSAPDPTDPLQAAQQTHR